MGKIVVCLSCTFNLFVFGLYSDDVYAPIPVYEEINDICNPTEADLMKVQHYLTHGERSIIKRLKDYEPNARHFKIIGSSPSEKPQHGKIAVNCDDQTKENCLLVYSSFNKNYPRGLKRLVDHVKNSDFIGHILYRLGGWPNIEGGSLVLTHVPYAFKVSFFKEAQRLGYKRALLLDTAILPVVSLNKIFEMIQEKGYFILENNHMVGPYMDSQAVAAFGLTVEDTGNVKSCLAGLVGFDFTSEKGADIIDRWYRAAMNKVAFFSPRSDQNALSIILHSMDITDLIDNDCLAHNKNMISSKTLLYIERSFVNEMSGIAH